jgi:hypothetical protein
MYPPKHLDKTMTTKTSKYIPPEDERELILAWIRRTRESQMAHYEMSNILSRRGRCIGVPVILISATVGTSAFVSLTTDTIYGWVKITAGVLSIVAVVLSSLQTFFQYSERAEKYRIAGAKAASFRRKFELFYADKANPPDKLCLANLREEYDKLSLESPHVPVNIFNRIQKNISYVKPDDKPN